VLEHVSIAISTKILSLFPRTKYQAPAKIGVVFFLRDNGSRRKENKMMKKIK